MKAHQTLSIIGDLVAATTRWFRCLALAGVGLGWGGSLSAEIQWQNRRLLLEPPAGAIDAAGEFVFLNQGATAVGIVEVRSSCECTVLTPAKNIVPPGEKGSVPFVYHVGTRQGRQVVTVTVTTSEPELRTHELTVEVAIKEYATVTPRFLYWRVGDEPTPKIFQVAVAADFRFVDAQSTSAEFSVEVAGQTERIVQLRVVPRDTWAKRTGQIKIRVGQEGKAPLELPAALSIQ